VWQHAASNITLTQQLGFRFYLKKTHTHTHTHVKIWSGLGTRQKMRFLPSIPSAQHPTMSLNYTESRESTTSPNNIHDYRISSATEQVFLLNYYSTTNTPNTRHKEDANFCNDPSSLYLNLAFKSPKVPSLPEASKSTHIVKREIHTKWDILLVRNFTAARQHSSVGIWRAHLLVLTLIAFLVTITDGTWNYINIKHTIITFSFKFLDIIHLMAETNLNCK